MIPMGRPRRGPVRMPARRPQPIQVDINKQIWVPDNKRIYCDECKILLADLMFKEKPYCNRCVKKIKI